MEENRIGFEQCPNYWQDNQRLEQTAREDSCCGTGRIVCDFGYNKTTKTAEEITIGAGNGMHACLALRYFWKFSSSLNSCQQNCAHSEDLGGCLPRNYMKALLNMTLGVHFHSN